MKQPSSSLTQPKKPNWCRANSAGQLCPRTNFVLFVHTTTIIVTIVIHPHTTSLSSALIRKFRGVALNSRGDGRQAERLAGGGVSVQLSTVQAT